MNRKSAAPARAILNDSPLRTACLTFALVFFLGVITAGESWAPLAAVASVGVSAILVLGGLGALEVAVILIPVMFYLSLGTNFNLSAADLLVPALILQVMGGIKGRDSQIGRTLRGVTLFIICLMLAVGLSMLNADLFSTYPTSLNRGLVDAAKLLLCGIYAVVFLVLAWGRVASCDLRFLEIWVWTSVSIAVLACLSLFVDLPGFTPYSTWRATGSFEDPNLLGAYLLCSIGFALGYNLVRFGRPSGLNVLLLVLGVFSTGSRAALISLGLGLAIFAVGYLILYKKIDLRFLAAGAIALLSFPLWGPSVLGSGGRGEFSIEDDVRFDLWGTGLAALADNPVLGVGYGQFPLLFAEYQNVARFSLIHNTFLSFLVETGLIGAAVVVTGIGAVLAISLSRARRSHLAAGALVGLVMLLLSLLSINGQNVRFVWVFMAVALVLAVTAPKEGDRDQSERLKRV